MSYRHHAAGRVTIGEKRNQLIERATGDLIAFFDDDDFYAPDYLAAMAAALGDADLVKLSGWFALSVPDDAFFFWDTAQHQPLHYKVGEGAITFVTSAQFKPDFAAKNVDGYGFSYLFRRAESSAALCVSPTRASVRICRSCRRCAAPAASCEHVQDDAGLVVHLLHNRNSSVIFPQYRLPRALAARLFPGLPGYLASIG